MELDSVARRRSARTARRVVARVASAPATSSPGLGWRPWASLLCHSAVRLARRCLRVAGVACADAASLLASVASQLLAVFAFVWLWHFVSPAAASLPGYKGFGRFARARARCALRGTRPDAVPRPNARSHARARPQFLTFCSFTWQLVVWTLAVVTDVVRARRRRLSRLKPDVASLPSLSRTTTRV